MNEETSHQHGTEGMKDRWRHGLRCHSWIVVEIRMCSGLEHGRIWKPPKLRTNSREVRKVVEDHHGDPYEDHGTPIFQKLLTFEFATKTMVVEQLPSTIGNQRLAQRSLLPT
ncbi:MAG: hypothetical protein GY696_36300 [Gammaproteobacteria bacterium]|nr:hypothetical protein [Gammaproteobacteria bacterium]